MVVDQDKYMERMKKKEFKLQWPKSPFFNKNSGEEPKSRLNETRTAPYEQVVLGIMLENYSKFNLKNPTFHRDDYWCGYTRRINPIRQVDSGSGKLFVVDNDASKGAICGSVSWQLNDGYKDLNVRLVLTFDVPWKGSCTSKSRGNQYTIVFDHLEKHHQNESWYKKYYDTFGRSSRLSTACSAEIDQNLVVRFNNDNRKNSIGRAFAHVHMDSTCASLLKVRFFGELDPFYSK